MEFEAIENSAGAGAGGVGIATGQLVASKGAQAVLTGNCGPNAHQVLSSASIQVFTGVTGKVRDAVQSFKEGKYKASAQPNVAPHSGQS
jgi:predicted Fe-Mo cluster-binding NifX family protein